jgi:hypothetical protein
VFRWIDELVGADFGDIRLNERLVKIVERFGNKPDAGIPEACGKPSQANAAYRFLNHKAVTLQGILQPHIGRTVERARQFSRVLAIQDTTEINLTSHKSTAGLGYLAAPECRGIMLHNLMCVSTEGVPLGLLGQFPWTRDVAELGKRTERNKKRVDEKESQRWLEGLAVVEEHLGGETQVVLIADSEADLYDLFAKPRSANIDLLVRVYHRNRLVEHPARHLERAVLASPPRAVIEIDVPRGDDRPARKAQLTVRWCKLQACEPVNYMGVPATEPMELSFLHVREENPPPGQEPLEWLLATTLPIEGLEDARQILQWYTFRWRIERFHFVLKSGCKIESRCLRKEKRMENLIALLSLVAWKVLWVTYEARENPTASCRVVFDKEEAEVLHLATRPRQPLPQQPATLQQAVRDVAKLGGYLGRRNDPPPGVKTIWRGLRRLEDLTSGYKLARKPNAIASNKDYG